jgi:hypothetical protein
MVYCDPSGISHTLVPGLGARFMCCFAVYFPLIWWSQGSSLILRRMATMALVDLHAADGATPAFATPQG